MGEMFSLAGLMAFGLRGLDGRELRDTQRLLKPPMKEFWHVADFQKDRNE